MTLREQIAQTVFEHETTAGVDNKGAADAILDLFRENITLEWDNKTRHGKRVHVSGDYTIIEYYPNGHLAYCVQYRGLPMRGLASDEFLKLVEAKGAVLEHYRNTIITALGG